MPHQQNKNTSLPSAPYILPVMGSWNPDETPSSISREDFIEAINFRKARPAEWETRSGIKSLDHFVPADPNASPPTTAPTLTSINGTRVAIAEYRLDDTFANVVIFEEGGSLKAWIKNEFLADFITLPICTYNGVDSFVDAVEAIQFNNFLIVTVLGYGLFALAPLPDTNLATWDHPRKLGKALTPTPQLLRFKDDVTGDLIVYEYVDPIPNNGTDCKPLYGLSQAEPIKIRLPMGAPYKRVASNAALISTDLVKQFEPETGANGYLATGVTGSTDSDTKLGLRSTGKSNHLQKRGWFYRFIAKSQYTDPKGQRFVYYHEASVDIYVPDNDYAPPFIARDGSGGAAPFFGLTHTIPYYVGAGAKNSYFTGRLIPSGDTNNTDLRTFPELGATSTFDTGIADQTYVKFIEKFRSYFHDSVAWNEQTTNPCTQSPYYFVAVVMGYVNLPTGGLTPIQNVFWYMYPYKISVSASELLGAPQTVFNWTDFPPFSADAGDVFEIEVHRTPHIDSPLFTSQNYGYVGTIVKDGSFTDITKDSDIDFNGIIDSQEGYLIGEISAAVIATYNGNIRLLDLKTHYEVRKPSVLVQQFYFDYFGIIVTAGVPAATPSLGAGLIPKANLAPGILGPLTNFAYQYVDANGYCSELTGLGDVDTSGSSVANGGVAFTFPHGYSQQITKIYVFEGRLDPVLLTRSYHRIGVVETLDGHFIYQGLSDAAWLAAPSPSPKSSIDTHDQGASGWTQSGDMFDWPQLNFEIEHPFAKGTYIGDVSGPAYIFTDQSVNMTTFAEGLPNRWEIVSDAPSGVGCIGRWAATKVGKAIFFLSSKGVYLAEGSGVRPFPGNVQTVVLKYLSEEIPGVARLANGRRATMKWLGQRNELWLHFPSSHDLGGTLPAITIIYRMLEDFGVYGKKDVQNYRFEMIPGLDPMSEGIVLLLENAHGRLFATYNDGSDLHLIDCDSSADWSGDAYLSVGLAMEASEVVKKLSEVHLTADAQCRLFLSTGMIRTDNSWDVLTHGPLHDGVAETEQIVDPAEKFLQYFAQPASGDLINHTDRIPVFRIRSSPDTTGAHKCRIKSIDIESIVTQ